MTFSGFLAPGLVQGLSSMHATSGHVHGATSSCLKPHNFNVAQVLDRSHVRMVVWERGAGRTLACGTGACATVVAGVLESLIERTCQVDLPGGPLFIQWRESNNHVYMTGPAEPVFAGSVSV